MSGKSSGKRGVKPLRVFLDTSVLLSGLNSPTGASAVILWLFRNGKIIAVISPEVIAEAELVLPEKFPLLKTPFINFLLDKPALTKRLTEQEIRAAQTVVNSEDTPILAGAIKGNADVLVTLDKRFQHAARGQRRVAVMPPGEFLKHYGALS